MKCSRKACLGGELRVERYFREWQSARRQFCHRILQSHATNITVGRDSHCECKFSRKMEGAVTRDSSKCLKGDVIVEIGVDIFQHAAKPDGIQTMGIALDRC